MGGAMILVFVVGYDRARVNLAISVTSMWLVAVAVCAVLSAIIYGLHREIEKVRRLGQYTLEEKIGEGGMGAVYRARHAMLRRPTAVKLLRHDRVSDDAVARFEREVQRTAELTHPNTITVYDFNPSRHQARQYRHRRTRRYARRCHGSRLDFGLVRELQNGPDTGLTQDGKIGTPMYLAREVIKAADAADARSDIYALGAVAYFMLTGHTVFAGNTIVEVCGHHLYSAVKAPSERLGKPIDAALEDLVLRCLAKEPNDRPGSAREVSEALARIPLSPWTARAASEWWETNPVSRIAPRNALTGSETQLDWKVVERSTRSSVVSEANGGSTRSSVVSEANGGSTRSRARDPHERRDLAAHEVSSRGLSLPDRRRLLRNAPFDGFPTLPLGSGRRARGGGGRCCVRFRCRSRK